MYLNPKLILSTLSLKTSFDISRIFHEIPLFLKYLRSIVDNKMYFMKYFSFSLIYMTVGVNAGGVESKLLDDQQENIVRTTIQNHIPGIPSILETRRGLITECQKPIRLRRQAAMRVDISAVPLQMDYTQQTVFGRYKDAEEDIYLDDRRKHFNHIAEWPYSAYGVVTMRFPHMVDDQPDGVGTGSLIAPTIVLTCAHNLYNNLLGGRAKSVRFFPAMDGRKAHFGEAKVREFHYPKIYEKTKKEDYGILILEKPFGDETGYLGIGIFLQEDVKSFPLSVIGYPGDKIIHDRENGNAYELWGMSGPAKTVDKDYITYDEIDTFEGQSGSPVCFGSDEDYYAIGVHVLGGSFENKATLLTKARYQKIDKWVKKSIIRRVHDHIHFDVRNLDLSWNDLGDKAVLVLTNYNLPLLEHLNMEHNKIVHSESLACFKGLTSLDLHMNSIKDESVSALANLPVLKKLTLSCNKLTYKGAEFLQACTTLEEIDLHGQFVGGNAVGNKGAIALANLPFLRILNLNSNSVGNAGAEALAKSKTLINLDLSHNSIGSKGAKALAGNLSLKYLNLCWNNSKDEGAASFCDNQTIVNLDLSSNAIYDKGAIILAKNKTITFLDLGANYIGDDGAQAFADNTTLKILQLNGNRIKQAGGEALAKNMTLESLNLEDQFMLTPFKDGKEALLALKNSQNPHLRAMTETTEAHRLGTALEGLVREVAVRQYEGTFDDSVSVTSLEEETPQPRITWSTSSGRLKPHISF